MNEEPFITWFIDMTQSCKTMGVPFSRSISRVHQSSLYCHTFKNLPELFILLYFCKSYLLKLSFVLQLFSSHYPKHATILVHENCWDSLKAPPDFFTFMWYSCRTWVITKTFPAMQDMNGTSAKTFSDMRCKTLNALVIHV